MYLITVYLPEATLKFTVEHYAKGEGRILFTDRITNLTKDFPASLCAIEEIKEVEK